MFNLARRQDYIALVDREPSVIFFDMEMTGGNTRYDEILQFSIIDLYKGFVFNEYIKPRKCKSWKDTENIHHITPQMVQNCFTIGAFRSEIKNIFKRADMVVGYGIENDLKFMQKDRIYVGRQTVLYDLQKSFARIYSSNNNMPSLKSCANYCHCPDFGEIHNSLTDVYITVYCFITMYGLDVPEWLNKAAKAN